MSLSNFLNPKSIAIIGASNNKKKLGYQILSNLKTGGYRGKIYPVNLHDRQVENLKAYQSISLIHPAPEMAVIVVPAPVVVAEVKKCAVAKIKSIVIISAGFAESSPAGRAWEEEISRLGQKNNLNILGPNCLGVINYEKNINLTYARVEKQSVLPLLRAPRQGRIAFLSQSGAIDSAVLDWSAGKKIGWSYFISLGNKAVLDENDFFRFFAKDKNTELILSYLEEIKKGEEFMEIISGFKKEKKVAILKAGRSAAGSAAALSHTGSMAGSYESYLTGARRVGALNLNSLEEVFNLATLWQRSARPENEDLYIISNAGGPLVITADLASRRKISLGRLAPAEAARVKKSLPELPAANNPLDILGDADARRYRRALAAMLSSRKVSNLLVILTPQTATEVLATASEIIRFGKKYQDKMIAAVFIGGSGLKEAKELLAANNIPCFDYPRQAIFALSGYLRLKFSPAPTRYSSSSESAVVVGDKIRQMDYLETFRFLKKYDLPLATPKRIIKEGDLAKIKYPIALQLVGEKIIHKSDQNLIALNLFDSVSARQIFRSWKKLLASPENYCVAQDMGKGLAELLVGFKRDESFGPIIMVGAGGIYTEVLYDVQRWASDVDLARAKKMLADLKIYPILKGARGQKAGDIAALARIIVKVAKIAREKPQIKEVDINPLFAKQRGALAVDARIILTQ